MSNAPLTQIQERFTLEMELLRLERQAQESEAALRQAKFDLRESKIALAEYNGSFRAFRDRFSGKKEAAETALRHAVQKAEANLASAQREKERLDARLPELQEKLAALPAWHSLNDGSSEWLRLEALYCIEVLLPLLAANLDLLTQRRNQLNGTYAGQIKTHQTLAKIYSAPEAAGEACKPYILRLKAALDTLMIPFSLHSYFSEPTAFLSSATQYTRMDRINTSIAQVERMLQLLPKLQKELSE